MLTILFNINYWFYVFVSVWIPWDSCFPPMSHITSTHYSHNPDHQRLGRMASCGPQPPLWVAAAAGTAAARAAATPGAAATHAAATLSIEQR